MTAKFNNYLKRIASDMTNIQSGGGYSVNPEHQIAGHPVYQSFVDCSPPVLVNGKLDHNRSCRPMCGGARKLLKNLSTKRENKRNKKNKKSRNTRVKKHTKKRRKVRRRKTKNKSQRGGLNPGKYPIQGNAGNFHSDINQRTIGCNQPEWDASCI